MKVILLAGPGGSGKSTIAELVAKRCHYALIDGDQADTEFFADGGQWLPENTEKLAKAHDKIMAKAIVLAQEGQNVIIDYIVFGRYVEFLNKLKKAFGDDLQIRILFPSEAETIKRDKERACWTTGAERIAAVRSELEAIKDQIGPENFLDTTGQTPEETFNKYFQC